MSTKVSRASLGAAIVAAFLCGLIFASGFDLTRFGWAQSRVTSASGVPKPTNAQVASAAETETAFETVVDHARPAVVSIEIQRFARAPRPNVQRRGGGRGQPTPPGIEDFFRQFQDQPDQGEEASGSGFIVSPDGYILTNNHVVADADKVTVTLFDKRVFDAKVVGKDPTTDVAVVKIDEKNLPVLSLGDDSKARVGSWVLAIGNPLELNFTVTAGIVSAKGRNQTALLNPDGRSNNYAITDYIQTDAAINPGNSGGPLLNIHGDVIGINSAIASSTGRYEGYGFAIPITLAQQVMEDLIKYGKIRRAVVGVSLNDVTAADARAAGLAQIGGAKVSGFSPEKGSPAETAGIEIGDVITAAGGHAIDQVTTLQRVIRSFKPGDNVEVDVMRFGQKKTFHVKLGEPAEPATTVADNAEAKMAPVSDSNGMRQLDKLGISVSLIPAAKQGDISANYRNGLIITAVSPQGPSYRAPLAPSEVIVGELFPAKRDIKSVDDLQQAVAGLKAGDVIELKVVDVVGPGDIRTRAVSIQIPK